MSEMPKKIWADCFGTRYGWTSVKEEALIDDVAYIRADIVDELVTALKTAHCWTSKKIHEQHTAPLIEGALSKLEDDLEDRNDDKKRQD